jgi:hypothetical protein
MNFELCLFYGILLSLIIFGLIILIYYLQHLIYFWHVSYMSVTYKDKTYNVLQDKDNYENAAEVLYNIDNNLILLINHITKKYYNNQLNLPIKKYKIIKNIIYKLQKNYNSHSLKENFPSEPGKDVSFNINKGDHISLCLRDFKNPKNFHEFNDIMFVAIHELAHSCSKSYGHDDEFWYNFKFLLENAIEINIYQNINYYLNPVTYCSMKITYNPIFDISNNDEVYLKKIK